MQTWREKLLKSVSWVTRAFCFSWQCSDAWGGGHCWILGCPRASKNVLQPNLCMFVLFKKSCTAVICSNRQHQECTSQKDSFFHTNIWTRMSWLQLIYVERAIVVFPSAFPRAALLPVLSLWHLEMSAKSSLCFKSSAGSDCSCLFFEHLSHHSYLSIKLNGQPTSVFVSTPVNVSDQSHLLGRFLRALTALIHFRHQ